ncbi:hypothetical protein GM418_13205 [Maribellus comscasis]|uniref:PKD domain-containing protein n=1 Tax=Maribellus comscasis TaxID=2681766 RepID=A0A6I6JNP7_9BACT|nr:PKD domain-containing protein [Maribellus comscasis]QGY44586.1 hypothetical protein GM418_13205 [Maribellus comscasis]
MKKIKYLILVLFALSILASGCKKEENETAGKAVFSYVSDGFQVTFTNFTFGANEFEWDFDDGSDISTLSNPVHIFKAKGVYMVSLNAYTNGEVSNFTDSVVVTGPNIKIDGNFMDWDYVEYLFEQEESTGTLKSIKGYVDAANINFYLEGTEDMSLAVMDIYIDADNDPTTGYQSWQFPMGSGADILCEGNFDPERPQNSAGTIYDYTGVDGGWGWTGKMSFSEGMNFSKIATNNGNYAIEFSISKAALGDVSGAISFAFFELNAGWAGVGEIPVSSQEDSKLLELKF